MTTYQPHRLSPVHRLLKDSGGRTATVSGWQVFTRFTEPSQEAECVRNSAGLCDVSFLSEVDIRSGRADLSEEVKAWTSDNHLPDRWELARGHWLATSPVVGSLGPDPSSSSNAGNVPPHRLGQFHLTDLTSAYAAFVLAGPATRRVLQKLTTLDVAEHRIASGAAAQASLAHCHAIFLRRDLGKVPAFILLAGRDVGEYVWEEICRAGEEFDIQPFGLEALKDLMNGGAA